MSKLPFPIKYKDGKTLATLEGTSVKDAIETAIADNIYLNRADLKYAHLSGANLSGANLHAANLSGANLQAANLSGADLSDANLSDANLIDADLSDADLSGADLSGANLSDAFLSYANLSGANLSSADLHGAYLSDANLSDANLEGARLNWNKKPKAKNLPFFQDYFYDILWMNILVDGKPFGVVTSIYKFITLSDGALHVIYTIDEDGHDVTHTFRYDDVELMVNGGTTSEGISVSEIFSTKNKPESTSSEKPESTSSEEFVNNQEPPTSFSMNDFIIFVNDTMRNGGEYRVGVIQRSIHNLQDKIIETHGEEAFNLIYEIVSDLEDEDKKNVKKQPKKKGKKKQTVVTKENEELKVQKIDDLDGLLSSVNDIDIENINIDDLGDLENEEELEDINIDEFLND